MSWSVSAVGKAAKVAAKVKADLARMTCVEPEETLKSHAGVIIGAALAAMPADYPVEVSAAGSQSSLTERGPGVALNNLDIKIRPLWGYVE